ncbi:MAG TPA: hypothetical protein VFF08_02710, partial [Trueperaceae bacterium]|nr:hypothetical protein [Trueperaceae bacterium]
GDAAEARLRRLVERHAEATGSALAASLLTDWAAARTRFWHVLPRVEAGLGRPAEDGAGRAVRREAA